MDILYPDSATGNPSEKICSKCGKPFPRTPEFFYRNKGNKDGLYGRCKKCYGKEQKTFRSKPEVQERMQAKSKEYSARPEVKEQKSKYNKDHWDEYYSRPEVHVHKLAYAKERRNKPEVKQYSQEYMQTYRPAYYCQPENREHKRDHDKEYFRRPEVQERERIRRKKYNQIYLARPEVQLRRLVNKRNRDARKKSIAGTYTSEQIQEQLKRQHYRCYYAACGHATFEQRNGKYVYHIDHTFPINRVAGTDIPANDISYLVLACPSCNQSKSDKFPWEWPEGGRLL